MTDWISETFTGDAGWSHLESLVDVGDRMAGSPGERQALEDTRDALEAVGARDARIDVFALQGWVRGESAIYAGETVQPCLALPRSPSAEAEGELVDLGHGLPEDFDRDLSGAVAMASTDVPDHYDRFVHRREKYHRAFEAGAVGFVFRNHVPGQLPPTGSVGTPDSPVGAIPAVGVSREVGARLARRFEGEAVDVRVSCETPDAESGTVHADLGPDTDREVRLTCHVDAHDVAEGALDNGAGAGMVVEVARALAAREDELDTRVHLAGYGAEEVGLVGSGVDADAADGDAIEAVVNLDGVCAGRDLRVSTHGFDELGDAARDAAGRFDHPVTVTSELVPHSDHWPFVRRGIPGCLVGSDTGDRGRGWGHTAADTLDKLDRRTFREQAVLVTEFVAALASADRDVPRTSPENVAAALERAGKAEGLRATGDWPY